MLNKLLKYTVFFFFFFLYLYSSLRYGDDDELKIVGSIYSLKEGKILYQDIYWVKLPIMQLIYYPFTYLIKEPFLFMLLFSSLISILIAILFFSISKKLEYDPYITSTIFFVLSLSPLIKSAYTFSIEKTLLFFILLSIYFYLKENNLYKLFFAIATTLRYEIFFPIIVLSIIYFRNKRRELIYVFLLSLLIILSSFILTKSSIYEFMSCTSIMKKSLFDVEKLTNSLKYIFYNPIYMISFYIILIYGKKIKLDYTPFKEIIIISIIIRSLIFGIDERFLFPLLPFVALSLNFKEIKVDKKFFAIFIYLIFLAYFVFLNITNLLSNKCGEVIGIDRAVISCEIIKNYPVFRSLKKENVFISLYLPWQDNMEEYVLFNKKEHWREVSCSEFIKRGKANPLFYDKDLYLKYYEEIKNKKYDVVILNKKYWEIYGAYFAKFLDDREYGEFNEIYLLILEEAKRRYKYEFCTGFICIYSNKRIG